MTDNSAITRIWPGPEPEPLDDDRIAAAYATDRDRPWLRVNFVTSLDGAVTLDGYSAGLSGAADRRVFHVLRMLCDALVVGAGTLRREGYGPVRARAEHGEWRRTHGLAEHPTLVLVSSALELDPEAPLFTEAPVRPVVLTHAASPADRRTALSTVADVVVAGEAAVDLRAGLTELHARGLRQVLCEGGPHLFGSLAAADLVDELCLTVSPLLTGPGPGRIIAGAASQVRHLRLRQVLAGGDLLLLRHVRPDPPS